MKTLKIVLFMSVICVLAASVFQAASSQGVFETLSRGWQSSDEDPTVDSENAETPGMLEVVDEEGNISGRCPLKNTEVKAEISGFVARVTVTQNFQNPYNDPIEAVYTFPLSQDAAVDDMLMLVGDRRIKGIIKRREEAKRIYEEAKAAGKATSLLDQERPNIFTQHVANIMPGENISVTISYVELLDYEAGYYGFDFPMVVGPRYIPGNPAGAGGTGWAPDTDRVPDGSKITPNVTPEGTRAGHNISIEVTINAGTRVNEIESKLHKIDRKNNSDGSVTIKLKDQKTIPNKDFILSYTTADKEIKDSVLTYAPGGKDGFVTLIVQPPLNVAPSQIVPKEMIFVIDTSGSMSGWPIEKAKETMKYAINNMNPNDTFQLVAFSNNPRPLFPQSAPNTPENREKALRYLGGQMGGGGTEMLSAVHAVIESDPDPERVRIICFMTDGYVGDDMTIISEIKKYIGATRFFSFGVGNSVNRFLMDEMARVGRGEVEYVTLENDAKETAEKFYQRIANPVLTDITVDWGNLEVTNAYPEHIPDLFSDKPVIVKARYSEAGKGTVTIKGRAAGRKFEKKIKVTLPEKDDSNSSLASVWAREKVAEVMRSDYQNIQYGSPKPEVKEMIVELGLEFNLVTQYTSFVAVDEVVINEDGKTRTVPVPVEMPDGVSYDGVFGDGMMDRSSSYGYSGGGAGYVAAASPVPRVYNGGVLHTEKKARKEMAPVELAGIDMDEEEVADDIGGILVNGQAVTKLSSDLQAIFKVATADNAKETFEINGVKVTGWIIEVSVLLDNVDKETIEKLVEAGFKVTVRSGNTVVGKIDVRKLQEFSKIEAVKWIDAIK